MAFSTAAGTAAAQGVVTPAGAATDGPSAQPLNAYGNPLRPTVKRSALAQTQPYTPIKKHDDQSQIPEIEMFVGESRVFPTPGVARIAVGNGQIMTAAPLDGKEVILFANGVGTSSLFVWNEDGRYQRVKVNIVPGDTTRIAREVAAFLTTIPYAKASIVGDKVIVEGDNLSDADLSKIEQLEKRYPQIVNFTNRLGWEPMVMLDVKVVEFPVDELRDIGLKWSGTGGAAIGGIWLPGKRGNDGPYQINIQTGEGAPAPIVNPVDSAGGVPLSRSLNILSAVNMGLNAQLNLLAQNGKASILSEPQLSARSGSKASFLAGGEFPYSVQTRDGISILFKKYGVKLDIEPKVDRNGIVRATIDAEVSKIDGSVSTVAGPALLTRSTKTEFNVRSGETMVLSGLIQMDSSTNIDKVPLLGDVPVLGHLFRSKRFQNRETELVVFVTPQVVDSKSPGLVNRVERVHERLQKDHGTSPYLTNPLQPGTDPAKPNVFHPTVPKNHDQGSGASDTVSTGARAAAVPAAISAIPAAAPSPAVANANLVHAGQNPLHRPAMPGAGGSLLRVTREGLVLRSEPNAQSAALMTLGEGAMVQLGDAGTQPVDSGTWRNVVVGELNGWVPARWVAPVRFQPVSGRAATSDAGRIDQEGAKLELGANGSGRGVAAGATQPVTPAMPAAGDLAQDAASTQYRVVLNRLALRVTPDVNAGVVRYLSAGQHVQVLPQPAKRYWVAVQAGDARGWVASQWLSPAMPTN